MKTSRKKSFWSILLAVGLLISAVSAVSVAKSLYLASEHHTSQFDAWGIDLTDGTIAKQATYVLQHATDPAGIGIDAAHAPTENPVIFITSEFSSGVEIVDPVSLTYLGVSAGPSNLAGLDVDDIENIVYTLKRATNELYIYSWNPTTQKLTQSAMVKLPGLSYGYGLALNDAADILWVSDSGNSKVRAYDVDVAVWSNIVEIPALSFAVSHQPVDVAIDVVRNLVYTVGGWHGSSLLTKYNLTTGIETSLNTGDRPIGIAVEEITGYVYMTVYSADTLTVWDTSTSPFTLVQNAGDVGRPAGLAIGNISYNPLNLAKNDVIVGQVYIGSKFTYEITYENTNTYDVTNVTILDDLPLELDFISATHGGVYDSAAHTVLWNVGTVAAGESGPTIELVVKVNKKAVPGSTIYNQATIDGDQVQPTPVGDDEGSEDPDDEPGTPIGESIPVAVDIKPTSCPNPFNVGSKGVISVAIVGTQDFDVSQVDPASVKLVGIPPLRWSLEDVCTPYLPLLGKEDRLDCTEEGPDGYADLTLKFNLQEVAAALGDVTDGDELALSLTGNLSEEHGGVPILGEDVVVIVKKGK